MRRGEELKAIAAFVKAKPALALRNLRAAPNIEIFEITSADLTPTQEWRCGWFWWSHENPGEDALAEQDTLPAMYHGPYKSEQSALRASRRPA